MGAILRLGCNQKKKIISNLAGICVSQTHARPTPTIKMSIVCVGLTHAQPLVSNFQFNHAWA